MVVSHLKKIPIASKEVFTSITILIWYCQSIERLVVQGKVEGHSCDALTKSRLLVAHCMSVPEF